LENLSSVFHLSLHAFGDSSATEPKDENDSNDREENGKELITSRGGGHVTEQIRHVVWRFNLQMKKQ
jgi:hypothetical protein